MTETKFILQHRVTNLTKLHNNAVEIAEFMKEDAKTSDDDEDVADTVVSVLEAQLATATAALHQIESDELHAALNA